MTSRSDFNYGKCRSRWEGCSSGRGREKTVDYIVPHSTGSSDVDHQERSRRNERERGLIRWILSYGNSGTFSLTNYTPDSGRRYGDHCGHLLRFLFVNDGDESLDIFNDCRLRRCCNWGRSGGGCSDRRKSRSGC